METTMAPRNNHGSLLGYSALIADASGHDEAALVDLVEDFMRSRTGGTLDALSRAHFVDLAREGLDDILTWHHCGTVNGMTLATYCEIVGLTYPSALGTATPAGPGQRT
jgi:hypothetical protein